MVKFDFKKHYKVLYNAAPGEIRFVQVPSLQFLMVDGVGDPGTAPAFAEAIEALYSVSYTLKFMLKKGDSPLDYVVPPLESLWWAENYDVFRPETMDRDAWQWTLMIPQPEAVTGELALEAARQASAKKKLAALPRLRLAEFEEGLSVQLLHTGPYAEEAASIEGMHLFIKKNGCEFNGKHHEIYLNDPRRTQPEKLKTILRQPVRKT
jgi:hypothetical protein